jgi:hypothetical protein
VTSAFQSLTDLLPEPVVLVSPLGVIHAANRAFLRLAADGRGTVVGRTLA